MVIPAIMPRLSATDTAFLHLWTPQGLLCNPFIGIGGLSLACYRELGGSPMTRDCRFSRAHYFCELLVCIDSILGVPSLPQHLVECIRRIPVPATVPPTLRPPTPSPFPSPVFPPVFTTTSSPTTTTTPLIDDHAGHNHGPDGIHTDEEHLKFDLIKIICGAVGGVLGGIIITVIIVACCSCKRKRQTQPPKEPRPKLPPRRQESSIYAEVEDMGSGSGFFKASNRAPDVIGALADDKSYKGLNNQNHFKGSAKGFLGRPLSVESNHYSTITEDSKRNSKSSLYNKLRDGSTSVVCDHIYNRAQYHVHEGEEYDRIGKKLNSRDNPRTIMRKEACPSPTKKRVYFTLEPLDNLDPH